MTITLNLVQRIREEFERAPALRFTTTEAARFWALEYGESEQVLAHLHETGFLARGRDGRFGVSGASEPWFAGPDIWQALLDGSGKPPARCSA